MKTNRIFLPSQWLPPLVSIGVLTLFLFWTAGCENPSGLPKNEKGSKPLSDRPDQAEGDGSKGNKNEHKQKKQGGRPSEKNTPILKEYPNEFSNPSIVQILAHRDRYDGKEVRLKGFLEVRFEGDAIYLSKEDADHGISNNGFWVIFNEKKIPRKTAAKFHRKYVLLEGRFDKENRGHFGLWQGALVEVDRIYELSLAK